MNVCVCARGVGAEVALPDRVGVYGAVRGVFFCGCFIYTRGRDILCFGMGVGVEVCVRTVNLCVRGPTVQICICVKTEHTMHMHT